MDREVKDCLSSKKRQDRRLSLSDIKTEKQGKTTFLHQLEKGKKGGHSFIKRKKKEVSPLSN